MMKKMMFLIVLLSIVVTIKAEKVDQDTLRNVGIDEIVVIASPKSNVKLQNLPLSSSLLRRQDLHLKQVTNLKRLTAAVPNLFIPDYGSKLTSAIYIRGIGSRINTPAIGLYVDNIPYIDKSAYDFNFSEVEQVVVLRGPQGTLYGRNTMGGLIHIHTKSPMTYKGTELSLGGASNGNTDVSLVHYHQLSNQFAFSVGGFYEHLGGFFNLEGKRGKMDSGNTGGGKARAIWFPSDNLKLDFTLNYEKSSQGGYPYAFVGSVKTEAESPQMKPGPEYIGKIAYSDPVGYRRSLLNGGLNLEYQARNFILSSATGFQHLTDRMLLDQDFTVLDVFTLKQKQRSNTISEELTLKSRKGRQWQWTTGAFASFQQLHTDAPVDFKEFGVKELIEKNVNSMFPQSPMAPRMAFKVHNSSLHIGGNFDTPLLCSAIYHQSTFHDLGVKGLSLTVGLRLDYERMWLDYTSQTEPLDFDFSFKMSQPRPMNIKAEHLKAPVSLTGKLAHNYLQLLPKVALQYEWTKGNSVYATAAKGYRSGGYNIQMFSELAQGAMRNSTKQALMDSREFSSMSAMIEKMMPAVNIDVESSAVYKPEYTWNYELGAHFEGSNTIWQADLAAFYMDTRNQQVSQFAESGLGRITRNVGKSRSLGAEFVMTVRPIHPLSVSVSYGYTHAVFKDYSEGDLLETANETVKANDYSGNFVPFVPQHTLQIGGSYVFNLSKQTWLERIRLNAFYTGAGRIYWTESNNVSQKFYGKLNGSVDFEKRFAGISIWINNALNTAYQTFYFETMQNAFEQQGNPLQVGIDLRCRF